MFGLPQDINGLLNYFLVVIRISGVLFTAPVFGSNLVDTRLRLFISVVIGFCIYPNIEDVTLSNLNAIILIIVIVKELLIGVAMGLLALFMFVGVQFGGQVIGFQMGFGVVDIIDPQTNVQTALISQFQNIIMILIFLVIGGHRILIEAMATSFYMVPLGSFVFHHQSYLYLVKLFSNIFITALQIVAPVFVTMIIAHTVMGIIGRLVPQINLLIVGFPLQIAVGLIMLLFSMQYFYVVFEQIMDSYFANIMDLFRMLGV